MASEEHHLNQSFEQSASHSPATADARRAPDRGTSLEDELLLRSADADASRRMPATVGGAVAAVLLLVGTAECGHIRAGLSNAGARSRLSEEIPSTLLARGAREPRRWLVDHKCAAQGENCSQSQCCQRSGMACYRKNSSWSGCRRACTVGVDMDDPAHNLEPWDCADPEVAPGCSRPGEDCRQSGCCTEPGTRCYEKSGLWASCLASCMPGKHEDDSPAYRGPWTCKPLGRPAGTGHRPDLAVEYGGPSMDIGLPAAPPGDAPPGISLLCFAVSRSEGTEFLLVLSQFHAGVGIFACDGRVLFSDRATDVPDTQVLPSFWAETQVPGAFTASWVNSKGFMDAWAWIVSDGNLDAHDWVVKVDPDAVFFPDRLKVHLNDGRFKDAANAEDGAFLKNCFTPDLQLYGSLEVLSSRAVRALGRAVDNCRSIPDYDRMGEDMWLQKCLENIGVASVEDYDGLVADGYCPGGPKGCESQVVAFHPFKVPAQWSDCYRQATGSNEMYW